MLERPCRGQSPRRSAARSWRSKTASGARRWCTGAWRTTPRFASKSAARVEELWRGVDALEAARVGRGYRVAPELLTRDARLRVPHAAAVDPSVASEQEQEEEAENGEQPSVTRARR